MCRKKVLTIYSMNLLTMTELERHFTIRIGKTNIRDDMDIGLDPRPQTQIVTVQTRSRSTWSIALYMYGHISSCAE